MPSDLAYGERGAGEVIPPNAVLLFDIVVVDVEKVPNQAEIEEQKRLKEAELKRQEEEENKRRIQVRKSGAPLQYWSPKHFFSC